MLSELFLQQLKAIPSKWYLVEGWELWRFLISCFSEHEMAIESIIQIGYHIDNCYLREATSGDYPIIKLHEEELFLKSMNSGRSDLIPSITFSLPNQPGMENLSDMRILRIEFWKPGMAPLD